MRAWAIGFSAAAGLICAAQAQQAAPPPGADGYTRPDWLKKPSFNDILLVWPQIAASKGIGGQGVIKCQVNKQGLLEACTVVSETPPGRGFGDAALKLAPTFLMKLATRNGQPVVSSITIPVNFEAKNEILMPNALVVDAPAWSKAPTAEDIIRQIGAKVGDKFADGKVVFLCELNKDTGKVRQCVLANASPGMAQFVDVARALSEKFEAEPQNLAAIRSWFKARQTHAYVFMPFSFPDMASPSWSKRYLSHVQWVRAPDDNAKQAPFPDQALKAGLKEGSATVDCLIGADGTLSQCAVKGESAPGVGFGAMAQAVAEQSVVSRWTEEGLPVEGVRVVMQIKKTYDGRVAEAGGPTPATKP
jgi:TonB family protein